MSKQGSSITVKISDEMWMDIAKYCEHYKVSRSEAIRQLIQIGLDSE
jgi:metal-responsive CopG/Arc/MetJ family transcriptional regulator